MAGTRTRQRWMMIGLIIIGIIFTAFFGMRAFRAFKKFDGHGHRPPPQGKVETDVELIRDWMTIPFIARTYQVPPEIIFEALNIPPQKDHDKSLKTINDEYFPGQDGFVVSAIKETILSNQALVPPTAPQPPTAPAP